MSTESLAPVVPKKRNFFSAPPAKSRLSDTEIAKKHPHLCRQVLVEIFLGYTAFYLIRNNISLVGPLLGEALNYDKVAVGIIANAVLISYGLSKFFMAILSDRSNARYLLPLGLALSASTDLLIALAPWVTVLLGIFATVMSLNGWFQSMGWPPSGCSLVHWFSTSERGIMTAVWNCAHNMGGFFIGMIAAWGLQVTGDQWQSAFWASALVALAVAVIAFLMTRDTSELEDLPPIEEYRNDPTKVEAMDEELKSLSYWTIIFRHVLTDRMAVLLVVCDIFVYSMRYGVLNWIPFYLEEKHHLQLASGIAGFSLYELSGITGTLLCGIVADKVFKGWRSDAGLLLLGLTGVFVITYWLLSMGTDFYVLMTVISCIDALIYGPVMLIGLQTIGLSPRNVAGTAAGFTGLFGYLLGATIASSGMDVVAHQLGWNAYFIALIVVSVLAALLMLVIGKNERQLMNAHQKKYSRK